VKAADLHRPPIFPCRCATVQCNRGRTGGRRTGAWCIQATVVEGQGRHRPKPGRTKANGRLGRGRGTGRSRTVGQQLDVPNAVEGTTEIGPEAANERSGATVGTTEAGPGVADRRPRSSVRPRPDGGPGSPCLDAYGVGKHQPPTGLLRPFSPEGEGGRGCLADASHGGPPVGGPAS
jgi:hypothetical protein